MTDNLKAFCRYQNTDEARAFREAIDERAEVQAPEGANLAVNLIRDELKELRASFIVGNPGSGMMKHS